MRAHYMLAMVYPRILIAMHAGRVSMHGDEAIAIAIDHAHAMSYTSCSHKHSHDFTESWDRVTPTS
jgi:hypothetical protein